MDSITVAAAHRKPRCKMMAGNAGKAMLLALVATLAATAGAAAADVPTVLTVAVGADGGRLQAAAAPGPLAAAVVTGSLKRADFPNGIDFWNPNDVGIDRIPAGYGNTPPANNTNVPVQDRVVEFGYEESVVLVSGDLTTSGVVTFTIAFKQAVSYVVPLNVAFQSAGFKAFKYLEEVSSNLALPLNATLSGDTLLISTDRQGPGFTGSIVQAVFKLTQCAKGSCCDKATGLFKPASTICRRKESPCDATERYGHTREGTCFRCTGSSAKCPNDIGLPDGSKCLWYANGDGDYGYYSKSEDRSSLKMSVVQPAQVAAQALTARKKQQHRKSKSEDDYGAGEEEVCMGTCEAGTCYMDKQEAACCVPAKGPGRIADDDAAADGSEVASISSASAHYCWGRDQA